MAMDPDQDDFIAVKEFDSTNHERMTYTRREWTFTWTPGATGEGTLVIGGATMQAGSTVVVYVQGPEHGTKVLSAAGDAAARGKIVQLQDRGGNVQPSGADASVPIHTSALLTGPAAAPIPAGGPGQWSVGQDDFTAAWVDAENLTLGTFPTPLGTPVSGDFFMVTERLVSGEARIHVPTENDIVLAGQNLNVVGASFVNGSVFDVFCWGPPRGYDASTNSDQVTPITIPRPLQDSPQKTGSSLGDDTFHEYFDVEQGRIFTNEITDTPGAAGDNTYTLWTSARNDGTAEAGVTYYDRTLELLGQATVTSAEITADPSIGVWTVDGFQAKRVRITMVRANDGANTDGAYQYDMMWS